MPWSIDGTDSFLVTSDDLREAAIESGFSVERWTDETGRVNEWFAKASENGPPAGPALPMLIDDGFTRIMNLAGRNSEGNSFGCQRPAEESTVRRQVTNPRYLGS